MTISKMSKSKSLITILELRRLLTDLKEKRPDVCIRYRLLGEMWINTYRRVVVLTEKGAIFNDEEMNKLVNLPDLSMIMQFELDQTFQEYQPHFHYDVESTRPQ
jgi:hypothetical protein